MRRNRMFKRSRFRGECLLASNSSVVQQNAFSNLLQEQRGAVEVVLHPKTVIPTACSTRLPESFQIVCVFRFSELSLVGVSLRNPAGEPIPDGRKPVRMAGIKTTSHRSELGICLGINFRMSCSQSGFFTLRTHPGLTPLSLSQM